MASWQKSNADRAVPGKLTKREFRGFEPSVGCLLCGLTVTGHGSAGAARDVQCASPWLYSRCSADGE